MPRDSATRRATRPATRPGGIPGLTGGRGLACLTVAVVHVVAMTAPGSQLATALGPLSSAAVTFFFALSAFLLGRPFVAAVAAGTPLPRPGRYAAARLRRVFPAYVVIFLVADLALRAVYVRSAVIVQRPRSDVGAGRITALRPLVEQLTLTQNLRPGGLQTGLNPSWSLTTELCFYAVLPLLGLAAVAAARRGVPALRAAALPAAALLALGWAAKALDALVEQRSGLPTGFAQFGPYGLAVFSRSLLVAGDAFGWGLAAGVVHAWVGSGRAARWTPRRIREVSTLVWVPAGGAAVLLADDRPHLSSALFSLAAGALLVTASSPGAERPGRVGRALDAAPLRYLGRISLSLYLWHYPVLIVAIREHWIGPDSFTGSARSVAVVLAIAVALSALTYRLVEQPAVRRRRPAAEAAAGRGARGDRPAGARDAVTLGSTA